MKIKNNFFLIFALILVSISSVFSAIIPTNEPMRIQGNFLVNGSAANTSYNINAYVGSTLDETLNSDGLGNYILTVDGLTGNNVSLKVCGIYAESLLFTGFTTQNVNIDIPLQQNGTLGCTCDSICSGGTCVNSGFTTGVCSSNSYYCDADSTCESAYGETSSNCPTDCSSGGGGGGGGSSTPRNTTTTTTNTSTTTGSTTTGSGSGSGSTSTTLILITVPGIDTLEERNEIVSEVTKALEINTIEIESIEQETETQTTTEFTLNKDDTTTDIKTDFNQVVQNAVNAELEKYDSVQVSVSTKSKVMKVTKKDGTEQKVTRIEKEITISSTDIKGNTVRVIQVIPKEVASSASKISGNFVVLEDDPVLAFDIPVSSIVNGKVNVDYTVAGDVLQSSLDKIVTSVVDKTTIATNNVIPVNVVAPIISDTPLVAEDTTQTASNNNLTRILIVVVLVIVIAIAFVFVNSKNKKSAVIKNDSDDFISITYSYSSTDKDYRKIKDYIERYKHEYSKELLVDALRKAKFSESLIKKVLHEEYTLNKDTEYYMPNTYTYTSKDPNYRIIKDYIEKYKYEYSKKDLVNALKKQNFSEDAINKVLHEEYK